jgi:hypothetical protein
MGGERADSGVVSVNGVNSFHTSGLTEDKGHETSDGNLGDHGRNY